MSRNRRDRKTAQKELLAAFQAELQKLVQSELEKWLGNESRAEAEDKLKASEKAYPVLHNTKYRPEYCRMLLKHAAEGKNLIEFAGKIEIHTSTIYNWAKKYPEFNLAVEIANYKIESYWWEQARKHMLAKFSYDLFLFVMVNHAGNRYRNPDLPVNPSERLEVKSGVVFLPEVKTMEEIVNDERLLTMNDER